MKLGAYTAYLDARPRHGVVGALPRGTGGRDPDMAVNIEHEDQELDQLEGLRSAAQTLLAASGKG
jgi:hypothetical protein